MKRLIPVLLALLILCGCASQPTPTTPPATEPAPTEPAPTVGIYDAGSGLERNTAGAIRVYPLNQADSTAIAQMGSDILVFSNPETTTITKYSGDDLFVEATVNLRCGVHPDSPAVVVCDDGLTYYDFYHNQLVYLNEQLEEVMRRSLPDTLRDVPAISADRKQLYYCTEDSLRCLDLETGLDRLVKELYFSLQSPTALHCGDTVISCTVEDTIGNRSQLFISTETGRLLYETYEETYVQTKDSFYFCVYQDGIYPELLIGDSEQGPTLLQPHTYDSRINAVIENKAVVLVTENTVCNTLQMDHYDLQSGKRTASLTIPDTDMPFGFSGLRDSIWFLRYDPQYGSDVLCQWDISRNACENEVSCLSTRYSMEKPDYEGIAACREIADRLSRKYGVQILLWTDATAFQPWDYTLVPEHQVPVIRNELKELETFLALYPQGFLQTAAVSTTSGRIQIALVRSILGNADAGRSMDEVVGLQFWDEHANAYLCLSASQNLLAQNACHEMFHIIESRVMTFSKAYDDWNTLNPKGFEYDYDYIDNLSREDDQWLHGPDRAFIDSYSMSYPREDRARIMEYAMMDGNENCFASETMQKKLRQLCIGIRETFGMKNYTEPLLWEQYLKEPIK